MKSEITTAVVLSAGLGTRMKPLTDHMPKPLVKLDGRPLLDHVLDRLAEAGIRQSIVNVHYFADQIQQHVAFRRTPEVIISDERGHLLETGGGVRKALPLLGTAPFLVHNSDSVWREDQRSNLKILIDAWKPEAMSALLLLASHDSSIGFDGRGDFFLEPSGQLRRRGKADAAPFVFAGVSILKPQLFAGIVADAFSLNVIFDRAIAAGQLFGVVLEGLWMHVGTPESLIEAESRLHEMDRRRA